MDYCIENAFDVDDTVTIKVPEGELTIKVQEIDYDSVEGEYPNGKIVSAELRTIEKGEVLLNGKPSDDYTTALKEGELLVYCYYRPDYEYYNDRDYDCDYDYI